MSHRFPYRWNLSDGYPAERNGLKVFSTFACGGGSTMGYKLAGYDVLGCLEIDPQIIEVYKANHRPRLAFREDIRTFRKRDDLPPELYDLDILDGSPPCSTFSTSGNRDKDWGKAKKFREGQAVQRLDDLFFDFIALADKLRPKVVIAENVKGMIIGKAKGYCKEIKREFERAGYRVQLFLLNAASMGVPQKRERVFFVCSRKDLELPPLRLAFNEPAVPFGEIRIEGSSGYQRMTGNDQNVWRHRRNGDKKYADTNMRLKGKPSSFNAVFLYDHEVCPTIVSASGTRMTLVSEMRKASNAELRQVGTFPLDYDFGAVDSKYLIGMSVPPVMVAQIATEIREQWFGADPTPALNKSPHSTLAGREA